MAEKGKKLEPLQTGKKEEWFQGSRYGQSAASSRALTTLLLASLLTFSLSRAGSRSMATPTTTAAYAQHTALPYARDHCT